MSFSVLITLTLAGGNTGPFDLYSDADNYATAFETGVSKSNLTSGYLSNVVPDGATIIKCKSNNGTCNNFGPEFPISGLPNPTPTPTMTPTPTSISSSLTPILVARGTTGGGGTACINAGNFTWFATVYSKIGDDVLINTQYYYESDGVTPYTGGGTYSDGTSYGTFAGDGSYAKGGNCN